MKASYAVAIHADCCLSVQSVCKTELTMDSVKML